MVAILCSLVAVGSASAATAPHAQARALLAKCLTGLRTLPIVKITSKRVAKPRAVKARHVNDDCGIPLLMERLALPHPHDQALQDALQAALALNVAVDDYVQYVLGVTLGRQNRAQFRRAKREVFSAKRHARVALRELR
ncbi:MAG TPA: hypothetical protein VE088_08285 [Gaiellaceae bacterium]|nr:hypothetical protein [Gaiellaceae bacterium]